MRKQNLLFSESYIMDNTTVAPLCKAQSRRGGAEGEEEEERGHEKGEGHPSLIRSPSLDRDSC